KPEGEDDESDPPAKPEGEDDESDPPAKPEGEEDTSETPEEIESVEVTDEVNDDGTVNTERLEATIEAGIEMGIAELDNAEKMQSAMDDAQALMARIEAGDETVTQEEVNAVTKALQDEIDAATADNEAGDSEETEETGEVVDINEYKTETGVDYSALIAAIDAANAVAIEQLTEAQQEAINNAIEVLKEAEAYNEAIAENAGAGEGTEPPPDDGTEPPPDEGTEPPPAEDTSAEAEALQKKINEAVMALNETGIVAENFDDTQSEGDPNEGNTPPAGGSGEPGGGPGGAPGGGGGASGDPNAAKTYNGEEVSIVLNTVVAEDDAESEILEYFKETLAESTDNKITVTINYEVEVEIAEAGEDAPDTLETLAEGEAQIAAIARTDYRDRLPLVNAVPDFAPEMAQNNVDYYKNLFQDDEDAAAALEEEGKTNGATYLASYVVADEAGDSYTGGNILVADLEWWETLSDDAQEFILQAAQDAADHSAELIDGSGASGEAGGDPSAAGGEAGGDPGAASGDPNAAATGVELTEDEIAEWTTAVTSAVSRAKSTAEELEMQEQFRAVLAAAADFIGVDVAIDI
ncbi:MAG: hypothetical protein LUE21_12265, partial [Oscillospiraceae bacterium]|nr:hypothetical protein [Oscillospiraceae bacterium]